MYNRYSNGTGLCLIYILFYIYISYNRLLFLVIYLFHVVMFTIINNCIDNQYFKICRDLLINLIVIVIA